MSMRACRFCGAPLRVTFCDLGMSPLANAFIKPSEAHHSESFYPLHAFVCEHCFLVQLEQFETPERLFSDYVYFSSYSDTWLEHCRRYAHAMCGGLGLGAGSLVLEIASNDGYLLQFFKQAGIPVLGIEPARNVAAVARERGIATISEFFGRSLAAQVARDGKSADLLIANNVLAHVPELNDFVAGLHQVLKPSGVVTLEFPHLLRLVLEHQFDTIYHEHFSYFSLSTASRVLERHGLQVHDVEELPTHGGSLRMHASHAELQRPASPRVKALLEEERRAGLGAIQTYESFSQRVKESKYALLELLIEIKRTGKRIAGYGAPAKGNTLLNYCGIRTDFLEYTVDRNPYKQGLLLPGSRIPVYDPEKIVETRPDYVFILPWNLKAEICSQMATIRDWGGKFVLPAPEVTVI
jgi:2-polyprenyl-3-methyl-5-hydroxy-6-metoxy-1,4-benzoquinol methylase